MSRLPVSLGALGLVGVLVLMSVPTGQAAFVASNAFETGISPNPFGSNTTSGGNPLERIALLTGSLDWTASGRGLFVATETRVFRAIQVDSISVYNESAIAHAQKTRTVPKGPLTFSYGAGSLVADIGSAVLMLPDDVGISYSCITPFGAAMPITLPNDLFEDLTDAANGTHLVSSSYENECEMNQQAPTSATYLRLLDNESGLTVETADGQSQHYTGTDWAFQITGTPEYAIEAGGIVVPFKTSAALSATAYGGSDVADRFTLDPLEDLISRLSDQSEGSNGDGQPQQEGNASGALDALREIAPVLDGVLLGNLSREVFVDGEAFKPPGWGLIRFQRLEANSNQTLGDIAVSGQARMILVDRSLYDTHSYASLGPLNIPVLSIVLWVLAAGAIVAGIVLRPFVGADQVKTFGLMRLLGFIFHVLAFVAAFVLFDLEVKAFLGTSLLTIFAGGAGGQGTALGLVAFFQLLPFSLALALFGLPMRFITNTALKFGGLRKAGGFGKGVGNLAAWGIGAVYLRVLLGGFLALVLDVVSGLSPGG